MMKILISGFGGQGILFAGKFLAYGALLRGLEVTWLPSYGPEMRGGTANCSVIMSDTAIGSPIVDRPDILIAMNLPSLERFEDAVSPGGMVFIDSSLVSRNIARADVESFLVPSTRLAYEHDLGGLANMVMLGAVIRKSAIIPYDAVPLTLGRVVSDKKRRLIGLNLRAIDLGYGHTI